MDTRPLPSSRVPARPEIKICGLSDASMIDVAIAAGAHEIGLVHFPKSPRHVEIEAMRALRAHAGDRARVAVVTVDADDELLDAIAAQVAPDTVQLHGRETPERVRDVRDRTGLAVMKAIAVSSPEDLAAIARFRPVADRILLDAKRPAGSVLPGGNGVSFDWAILQSLGPNPDIVLSGGIHPGNVADALRRVNPRGLDVSSGVERAPGVKDAILIQRFFDALGAPATNPERQPA